MNANIASCLLICTTLKGASFDKLNGGLNQIEELLKGIEGGEPGEPEHLVSARQSWERANLMEELDAKKAEGSSYPTFSVTGRRMGDKRVKLISNTTSHVAGNVATAAIQSGVWDDILMEKDNA